MTKSTRPPSKPRTANPTRKTRAPHTGRAHREQAVRARATAQRARPATRPPVQMNAATAPDTRKSRPSKKASITRLLQRPEGATLAELMAATGWLEHSVRASLTGLRRDGQDIIRSKDAGGATSYRIVRSD